MKTHTLRGGERRYTGDSTVFVKRVELDEYIVRDGGKLENATWNPGYGAGEHLRIECDDGIVWRQRCEVAIGDVVVVGKWRPFKRRKRYKVAKVTVSPRRKTRPLRWNWYIHLEALDS